MSRLSKILLPFIALVLTAVMVKLGLWQLDRADFKSQKQLTISTRINEDIQQLPQALISAKDWQYFRVSVKGNYLLGPGFFVDNIINNAVTGVSVVTPLKIQGSGNLVLVNRGWLPWGIDRTFLPVIETPEDSVELKGMLMPVADDHFYLKDPEKSTERRQLWSQLDLQRFKRLTEASVQPLILLLDEDQPGSYQNIWHAQDDTWIARHKAYAVQWFGLALTLVIITVVLGYKCFTKKDIS